MLTTQDSNKKERTKNMLKKLTRIERRIIRTMNVLHVIASSIAIIGFTGMFCGCSKYEQDMATFTECIIWLIIGGCILTAGILLNNYIERLHDDFCCQLGVFDAIGYKRLSHTYVYVSSDHDMDILDEREEQRNNAIRQTRCNMDWDAYFKNGGFIIPPNREYHSSRIVETPDITNHAT